MARHLAPRMKSSRSRRPFLTLLVVTIFVAFYGLAFNPAFGQEPATEATSGDQPRYTADELDGREGRPLALGRFRPEPMLKVESHDLRAAKFPVIDVHTHPRFRLRHSPERLDEYVDVMDDQNIAISVSLDGGLGERFAEHKEYLWTKYRHRFLIFANIDWRGSGELRDPATWDCHRPDFGRRMAEALADVKRQGASGLKLFKNFGLEYRNPDGSLIRIDDRRWDPIWRACGELGLVVIIHTADPAAFFLPIDERNERWEELSRHPDWSFYGDEFPEREELLAARNRVIERHPATIFLGAHMANNSEDLSTVAEWLETYPNLYVEIAARIAEIGRQPYTARKFFLEYSDRILFGTDGPRHPLRLRYHWRLLETWDEYFPYAENEFPPQGLWRIYGLGLPDKVLRKVYYGNALRIIPGAKASLDALGPEWQPATE